METLKASELKVCLEAALKRLESKKETINRLNVFPVPDGDTGTNMTLTVKSAVNMAVAVKEDSVDEVLHALSKGALMGARGNSGVILSQIFRGFAEGLEDTEESNIKRLSKSFVNASKRAYRAVMKPTEGTILTVCKDMANNAERIGTHTDNFEDFFREVLSAGRESLNKTPEKLPLLKEAGVVDSGGAGLLVFWEGFFEGLSGEIIDYFEFENSEVELQHKYNISFSVKDNLFNLKNNLEKLDINAKLEEKGSFVEANFGSSDMWEDIRKLEGLNLLDLKVESNEDIESNEPCNKIEPTEGIGIIAVSQGEGIGNLFKDLGVSVLSGGQTMNPSTEDFINLINQTPYKEIIILPNNKNIILAANQAKELSERKVEVVETVSIPQGISSAITFNPELSLLENKENMEEAIQFVKTGQVTYSIRDISINGISIKKDDIMGIMEKDIVANGKDINEVALKLMEKMTDEYSSMATIIFGEDLEEATAEELKEKYEALFPDNEIEIINGGQAVYYYIISIE